MNILLIDTTSATASVAVRTRQGVKKELHNSRKMNHLQNLTPMIETILTECELKISDITYIAVTEGPGSFTGIRIGAATAKMLAQTLSADMIAVPTLMAYAYGAKSFKGLICPMLDARRSQVYAAGYEWRNGQCEEVIRGNAYDLEDFLALTSEYKCVLYVGDGSGAYKDKILENAESAARQIQFDDEIGAAGLAGYALEIAIQKQEKGETTPYTAFHPVYMREAEAQRRLAEKTAMSSEPQGSHASDARAAES